MPKRAGKSCAAFKARRNEQSKERRRLKRKREYLERQQQGPNPAAIFPQPNPGPYVPVIQPKAHVPGLQRPEVMVHRKRGGKSCAAFRARRNERSKEKRKLKRKEAYLQRQEQQSEANSAELTPDPAPAEHGPETVIPQRTKLQQGVDFYRRYHFRGLNGKWTVSSKVQTPCTGI